MTRLGQYGYPAQYNPYPYGYNTPYYGYGASYTPYAQTVLAPNAPQSYNEEYYSYWLQPIDQSEMPDTPIPGFQGMGANPLGSLPMWMKVAFGLGALGAAYLVFKKK